nr:MAG TPA: hypothetical protein [Caudoviricetes sp.]
MRMAARTPCRTYAVRASIATLRGKTACCMAMAAACT